jgi:hypothetical protein
MLKDKEPIFLYINTHIINIIRHYVSTMMKEYGGLNSTRKGKGRVESLEKWVKLEGLSQK